MGHETGIQATGAAGDPQAVGPDDAGQLRPCRVQYRLTALLAGLVAVYVVGVPWLASVNGLALARAASAMAPFAVGDLVKTALTVGIVAGGNELLANVR